MRYGTLPYYTVPCRTQVACQEAAGARAWSVVRELLLTLHRAAMQQQQQAMDVEGDGEQEGPRKQATGPDALTRVLPSEGHILRLLIRCVMEEAAPKQQQQQGGRPRSAGARAAGAGVASGADGARTGTGGGGGGGGGGSGGGGGGGGTEPQPHHEMALYCNLAAVRLDALGDRAFFMGGAAGGREGEEQVRSCYRGSEVPLQQASMLPSPFLC